MARIHADQRYRDETNLIRLVEHLERAHRDASAVASAEALEEDYITRILWKVLLRAIHLPACRHQRQL